MGIRISRISRSSTSLRPAPPPARTISDPTPNSSSAAAIPSSPDLSSYEAACRADPDLRSFDSTVQLRTSRAINSIAVGLDARALSLDSLSQVTECLLEMNQEVVRIILQNKRDVWKNPELSDLVDDYFDNSLLTLDFCTALDACLKRAGHIESIINVALRKFQEEHYGAAGEGIERNYARTLEELSNFRAAGDPFTEEFFRVFNSIHSRQIVMFERLQAKKRKLDKKLKRLKAWRRVSNVIFITAFASVLICSVVAAAVSAPPVVTALAAAAAVPLGSMGRWLNSIWKNFERDLRGQTEIISSMQIGSYIVLNDLESIKRLVERFRIVIEDLLVKAEFAMRGEEAVVVAVEEIRMQVDSFIKTIQDLRKQADKCTQETRMARTLILRRIINHPSSSTQDIGMFS
ncbi:transmembrane protein [Perilla frutescens var. hirtella]|nr:transmembrane protein [Perilla frutescens var. frutescens]KAH6791864.1 transmembrane protein [Perilla frutescens var. hirtella]